MWLQSPQGSLTHAAAIALLLLGSLVFREWTSLVLVVVKEQSLAPWW